MIRFDILTPTLTACPLRCTTALKSILWETLFLDQLHDFSLLSWNSFLQPFLKSRFMRKNSLTPKNFIFEVRFSLTNIYLIKDRYHLRNWGFLSTESMVCREIGGFLVSKLGSNFFIFAVRWSTKIDVQKWHYSGVKDFFSETLI